MTKLNSINNARCTINSLFVVADLTVTGDDTARLAPYLSNSNAVARALKDDAIAFEDLQRMLWMEVALREPGPRLEIAQRILGRIHTRQRSRVRSIINMDAL